MTESEILARLAEGETVVTANRRLAGHFQHRYAQHMEGQGQTTWTTPDVVAWDHWLTEMWQEARDFAQTFQRLLRPHQEKALWERVIQEAPETADLLQVAGAAEAARKAWVSLHEWQVDLPHQPAGADEEAFRRWRTEVVQKLSDNGWVTLAEVPDQLVALFRNGALTPPKAYLLAGFDEVTPQQEALLAALRELGVEVPPPAPLTDGSAGTLHRLPLTDSQAEAEVAADWARQQLEAGAHGSIGIVAPTLHQCRDQLARALTDALHPDAARWGRPPDKPAFNLSLGRPLLDYPVVHTAFQALDLLISQLPTVEAGTLVRSPFLGESEEEFPARLRLDRALRATGRAELGIESLVGLLDRREGQGKGALALRRRLAEAQARLKAVPDRQRPSRWATWFDETLAALGWPGQRSLDSAEFQTVQAFRERLLDTFADLDPIIPSLGVRDALGQLRSLASQTLFQPEVRGAPIQVLGILEAAGQSFDSLWVLGMHEEAWPQSPQPNPFLPIAFQRDNGLPRATPAGELEFARSTFTRVCHSASQVVVSYPTTEGERVYGPSPLIEDWPEWPQGIAPQGARAWQAAMQRTAPNREWISDDQGPGVPPESSVPGGAALFKAQAACPFQAYGRHRLVAEPLKTPKPGLDARERGILAHQLMEGLGAEVSDQNQAAALDEEERRAVARRVAEAVVQRKAEAEAGRYSAAFQEVESGRLARLAEAWLAQEARRPTFDVIASEDRREVSLGGLNFTIRVDRVDRLQDGSRLLIDFKTGQPSKGDWKGTRPKEPQLPLYAVTEATEAVGGIAFGRLRPGEVDFEGLAAEPEQVPGLKGPEEKPFRAGSWEELLAAWEQALDELAGQIRSGDARVNPRRRAECRDCHLKSLCRISEQADPLVAPSEESPS